MIRSQFCGMKWSQLKLMFALWDEFILLFFLLKGARGMRWTAINTGVEMDPTCHSHSFFFCFFLYFFYSSLIFFLLASFKPSARRPSPRSPSVVAHPHRYLSPRRSPAYTCPSPSPCLRHSLVSSPPCDPPPPPHITRKECSISPLLVAGDSPPICLHHEVASGYVCLHRAWLSSLVYRELNRDVSVRGSAHQSSYSGRSCAQSNNQWR